MEYSQYESYLEECATNTLAISHTPNDEHFVVYDIEDVFSELEHETNYPALFCENPELKHQDNYSDNHHEVMSGAFMILSPVESGDKAELKRVKNDNLIIAKDVVKKMYNDLKLGNINGFDLNNVMYNKVGPVFDKHYGWRVTFMVKNWTDMSLDVSKYQNETKFEI